MQICLFLTGACGTEPPYDLGALLHEAKAIDGLRQLVAHIPTVNPADPYVDEDKNTPSCILQWYFNDLGELETALEADGPIYRALRELQLAQFDTQSFTQQIMAVRRFAPPQHKPLLDGEERCSYVVGYEGPARDFSAWLTHYLTHHPPLMLQLLGLRELEIYTRMDSRSGLPFAHVGFMQRNKVVFDDADALARALTSPVRDAMRGDFHALPTYDGATPHYQMRSIYGKFVTP
jgi:uncharacterized protein (TIGR02118 family)